MKEGSSHEGQSGWTTYPLNQGCLITWSSCGRQKKNAIKPQTCKLLVKMEFMPRMTAKGEVGTLTRQVGIKQNVLIEHNASTMNYFVLRCAFCALKASL